MRLEMANPELMSGSEVLPSRPGGEAERLTRTTAERNTALTTAALKLGHLAHHGAFEATAPGVLLEACERNGVLGEDGLRQCTATFDSGWKAGLATAAGSPRTGGSIPPQSIQRGSARAQRPSEREDRRGRPKRFESADNPHRSRQADGDLDAAEEALLNIGADLYQRGGMVVRAAVAPFKTAKWGEDFPGCDLRWSLLPMS